MTYRGSQRDIDIAVKVVGVCRQTVINLTIAHAHADAIRTAQTELFTATNVLAALCSTE